MELGSRVSEVGRQTGSEQCGDRKQEVMRSHLGCGTGSCGEARGSLGSRRLGRRGAQRCRVTGKDLDAP